MRGVMSWEYRSVWSHFYQLVRVKIVVTFAMQISKNQEFNISDTGFICYLTAVRCRLHYTSPDQALFLSGKLAYREHNEYKQLPCVKKKSDHISITNSIKLTFD